MPRLPGTVQRLNFRVDPELARAVKAFAKAGGLTLSQASRELLRQALVAPPMAIDRGWREGYAQGMAEVKRRFAEAAKEE